MPSAALGAIDPAVLGPVAALVGVVLGWALGLLTSRKERQWREQQTVRERQEEAAAALHGAIFELTRDMPQDVMSGRDAAEPLRTAHARLREAWGRSTLLNDPEIYERIASLDMALFIAAQDARHPSRSEAINLWPLSVAVRDVRKALDAFLRRETLPVPEFPSAREVIRLANPEGRNGGIEGLRHHLMDQGVM